MKAKTRFNEATGKVERWDEKSGWVTVADGPKNAVSLVESYQALGLTEAESRIAAGVDRAVRSGNVNKSFDSGVKLGMFEAAKRLGLSEAEAEIFADPKKAANHTSPFSVASEKGPCCIWCSHNYPERCTNKSKKRS